jgi:hypothetical protein
MLPIGENSEANGKFHECQLGVILVILLAANIIGG